jgi:two-component system sensor histidine kinase/response regulator
MVNQHSYDIVLMDMQMPVMDGLTATKEIRKLTQFKDLPILAMTANAMDQDKEKCAEAGMNDHVAKPIDPDELFNALLKWIKPKTSLRDKEPKQNKVTDTVIDHSGLQAIEGLDTQLGLKRVMGKMPLYLNMLKKYVETGHAAVSDLRNALADNDQEVAERVAHTCKGVNGNIGASALQSMAGSIEKLVKGNHDRDQILREFETFAVAQTSMVDAISSVLPVNPSETKVSTSKVLKKPMDKKVFDKFIALLKDDDTEASIYLALNETDFKAHFTEVIFNNMTEALLDFDFEKALALAIG